MYNDDPKTVYIVRRAGDVGRGTANSNLKLDNVIGSNSSVELKRHCLVEVFGTGSHIKVYQTDNGNKVFHIHSSNDVFGIVQTGIAGWATNMATFLGGDITVDGGTVNLTDDKEHDIHGSEMQSRPTPHIV